MATSHLATPQHRTALGFSSGFRNDDAVSMVSETLIRFVALVSRAVLSVVLVALVLLSFVAWIWIASFRNGWKLWDWYQAQTDDQYKDERVSYSLLYGLIIFFVSPVILFSDWSQKRLQQWLPDWMKSPVNLPVRQIIEDRLGIQLGEAFPNLDQPTAQADPVSQISASEDVEV